MTLNFEESCQIKIRLRDGVSYELQKSVVGGLTQAFGGKAFHDSITSPRLIVAFY